MTKENSMFRCLAFAALALAACTPEAAPPAPESPAAETSTPAPLAGGEIPAPAGELTVTAPLDGARLTSPLVVEGFVQNDWMFEGVFPVKIEVDGVAIAEAPGQQQAPDNWTNPGPVKFRAELLFDVTEEKAATLVLQEDMPRPLSPDSDEAGPARTLRIPVTLAPSAPPAAQ
jgi:hypothetical protein